jgi:hypothetical protein
LCHFSKKVVCETLFHIFSLSPCNVINRVDSRGEVLPHFQTWAKILVLLLPLLLGKYFLVVFIPIGTVLGVRDTHIEDDGMATLLETMCSCITAFASGWSLILGYDWVVFFSAGGIRQCIQPLLAAHAGMKLRFEFDTSKGQDAATQDTGDATHPPHRHVVCAPDRQLCSRVHV